MAKLITRRQWARVLEVNRLSRICRERGYHVRTGDIETMQLGGRPYRMERCADCTVRSEIHDTRWRWTA